MKKLLVLCFSLFTTLSFANNLQEKGSDIVIPMVIDAENSGIDTVGTVVVDVISAGEITKIRTTTGWSILSNSPSVPTSKTFSCTINNTGAATADTASGLCAEWVSSASTSSTGIVVVNLVTDIFGTKPVCTGSASGLVSGTVAIDTTNFNGTPNRLMIETNNASVKANFGFHLTCNVKI